ncbi:hypothetical protein [Cognatiluteimonas telluris]|uniref:hypothetical protein n=1 Tax=Cognatiluteimonas telluris TaxID=1104775 RepID=UPI001409C55D|nr:hypothetical protein [Lysobacter telluris]
MPGIKSFIAALIAILIAMWRFDSWSGRIVVCAGLLGAVAIPATLRDVRGAQKAGNAVDGSTKLAVILTALVWGWLPFTLGWRVEGRFDSPDTLPAIAVWVGSWIAARGIAHASLDQSAEDPHWGPVLGYLFAVAGASVFGIFYSKPESNPISLLLLSHGSPDGGALWGMRLVGMVVGALLCAAGIMGALVCSGAVASVAILGIARGLDYPAPRFRLTALVVGWALIPALKMLMLVVGG